MKRYRLKKDLPTFKEGELFHTDEHGNLWRDKGQKGNHWQEEVMAYHHKTIERFPDILTDWFAEIEDRDPLSKEAFIEYLRANPEQRLMQAVCNFATQELNQNTTRIMVELRGATTAFDTWHWECDEMMLRKTSSEAKEPEFTTFEDIEKRKKLKQMKDRLKEWAQQNDITGVEVYFGNHVGDDKSVRFRDLDDFNTSIEIEGWPRDGLVSAQRYGINYLLDAADEANKE
jgi:hypothetical protein